MKIIGDEPLIIGFIVVELVAGRSALGVYVYHSEIYLSNSNRKLMALFIPVIQESPILAFRAI